MKQAYYQNWLNKIRRSFLLTFFDSSNKYQEKEVNGFILVKQFNQILSGWEVAIYTREAFQKKEAHKKRITGLFTPRRNKQQRG